MNDSTNKREKRGVRNSNKREREREGLVESYIDKDKLYM